MKKQKLNLLEAPLRGTCLIEANAGTGKTYNITALVTRMVVESGYLLEKILVVTYTKAAVSDLKSKIYTRLCDVRDAMSALLDGREISQADPFPMDYAKHRRDTLKTDLKRVKDAVRDFDQCAVYTIHSFCQRMLKENAFSGNIPYDMEMTGDSRELITRPVYDYWRKNVYGAEAAVISELTRQGPDSLINFFLQVQSNMSIEVLPPDDPADKAKVIQTEKRLQDAFTRVKEIYTAEKSEIHRLMDNTRADFPLAKAKYKKNYISDSLAYMENAVNTDSHRCETKKQTALRFTSKAIAEAGEMRHIFFDAVQEWYDSELAMQAAADSFAAMFRYSLCQYLNEVLDQHKIKKNTQSYDDLISRMRDAVIANHGQSDMVRSLDEKYKAALIDEFQDTDPYQYDIFHTAFGRTGKPLFMIGDPKQAIYSFRGADVYAYLKAALNEENQYTLTDNYRSDPGLVEAVNAFFSRENAFALEQIEYNPSKGADMVQKLTIDGRQTPPITLWEAKDTSAEEMAKITARHIAELLNKAESGNADLNGQKVKPSDIAVLCRKKHQMIKVKNALSACGVPAVMSGSESVYDSDEARELAAVLAAVITPFSQRAVKTALITSLFGLSAEDVCGINEKDIWDDITDEFRSYNDLINIKGFAPMFFKLAGTRRLYERLAALPAGERKLTNLIHLAELAQEYEADKKAAPQEILNWLQDKIANQNGGDTAELKMDSDENAVTIITIHKSKGLEYRIVYTPFLMYYGKNNRIKKYPKYHEDGRFILDASDSQGAQEKSEKEEKAEDLRLAYVALTRGKAVCYTAWGAPKEHYKTSLSWLINGAYENYDPARTADYFRGTKVHIAPAPDSAVQMFRARTEKPVRENRKFGGAVPAIWRINSFSGLIHSSQAVKDTDQHTPQAAEENTATNDIFSFPKGAKAGTCLHECMEETSFEDFGEISLMQTVAEKLELFSFDPVFAPAVVNNISDIIRKDMNGISLQNLQSGDYIHEMEFQMCTRDFCSAELSSIFENAGEADYARAASTLSFEAVHGFMNGFADLIFRQRGRYYVLDWKSNHLGMSKEAYTTEKMHQEMLGSHYYMQLYIYTLALHLHLKRSLPDYDYDTHMGGGIYVFMRGVSTDGDEGIYTHRPIKESIEAMERLVIK